MASDYNPFSLVANEFPTRGEGDYGTGRDELNLAKKVSQKVGESRFSSARFGRFLYEASIGDEKNELLIAALIFIREFTQEVDRDMAGCDPETQARGFMAARIMDTLKNYGYLMEEYDDRDLY